MLPFVCRSVCLAGLLLTLLAASAAGQSKAPLSVTIEPVGVRGSVTEAWGSMDATVTNYTDQDRVARVVVYYAGQAELQYARDIWVPARSRVTSWMLTGPAPPQKSMTALSRNLVFQLYDRTDGSDRLIPPSPDDQRVRDRGVMYRAREPYTAALLDEESGDPDPPGALPQPLTRNEEILWLARTFRDAAQFNTGIVPVIRPGSLPVVPEAFNGIDQLVLASNRIVNDPAGVRAMRQWLMRGGRLWVLLDSVDPRILAPLLGDALDFQIVDRISLTTVRIDDRLKPQVGIDPPSVEYPRPVEFTRVLLPADELPRRHLDGWPLYFSRTVGRGKVVFTTLGPRAWTRPRIEGPAPKGNQQGQPGGRSGDGASRFDEYPTLPVALDHLLALVGELYAPGEKDPFASAVVDSAPTPGADSAGPGLSIFRKPLEDEIGYSIIGRDTVLIVFGAFFAVALVLGLALTGRARREWLGWLVPGLALAAAVAFVYLGEQSRRSAAPTVAAGQVVDTAPGIEESSVRGLMAMYRPSSGTAALGASSGGQFEVDPRGLEGQSRRLVIEDLDAWRWEGVSLPAGVRVAPFQVNVPSDSPVRAVARLGPSGLEGTLFSGPFQNLSDVLLVTPGDRPLPVRLGSDGKFTAAPQDALPGGQFLTETVLSDRQQRRQAMFRQLLEKPLAGNDPAEPYSQFRERPLAHLRGRNVLLAWADALDVDFRLLKDARKVGDALLVIPLELRAPAADTQVTIPGVLLPYTRLLDGQPTQRRMQSRDDERIEQHLRFQVPAAALPLKVEKARLTVRIHAPARKVTVAGMEGPAFTTLQEVTSPLDPIRVEINQPRFLNLDEQGGLHVGLTVSGLIKDKKDRNPGEDSWAIRFIELEITGRTLAQP